MDELLYSVEHETRTQYEEAVTLSQQLLHMTPRDFGFQRCLDHFIDVDPAPQALAGGCDYFGNGTRMLTVATRHETLVVHARSTVALRPRPTMAELGASLPWESVAAQLRQSSGAPSIEPWHFLYDSPHIECSAELAAFAATSFTPGRPLLEAAHDLSERICREFEFDPSATTIATPLSAVIAGRRGVCQDFAHLMTGCLRSIGLSCRYVSGYLLTTPPPGQQRLVGADASHAWVAVWSPGHGWVDFDPTNRSFVHDEHITLGWGRDFSDVSPMRGVVLGGGAQSLQVKVTVSRI